jgi:hypothetical protein
MVQSRASACNDAIRRGIAFIYQTACEPKNFELYGYDYLGCFHGIASTSKDPSVRRLARNLGRERARRWRHDNPAVMPEADADTIGNLVFGSYAADRLGLPDKQLKQQLQKVAGDFTALDYFWFDSPNEPPPVDVPDECECGTYNRRGRKRCSECRAALSMMSRYALWLDALTRSYFGERYGVRLGASFADVIKWLPSMRPYPAYEEGEGDNYNFSWAVYAVTHVVYTLNGYSQHGLSPRWLPNEYNYLKDNLKQAIVMEDPEIMGEFLDTLKSFGLPPDHPLIRKGMDYLLSCQNSDGSWGDVEDDDDIYQRYHPTWTAVDGLREYSWRRGLSFPELKPRLRQWARNVSAAQVLSPRRRNRV